MLIPCDMPCEVQPEAQGGREWNIEADDETVAGDLLISTLTRLRRGYIYAYLGD